MTPKRKKRSDRARLDWLSKNCLWFKDGEYLGVSFLPEHLEDGQNVRQALDAAMRREGRDRGRE